MPIVLEKKVPNSYHLMLWKVTETIEDLEKLREVKPEEKEKYASIKLDMRKREWLGRMLLFHNLGVEKLHYLENGKPVLEDGHISISHCDDLVVVILSDQPIGIDLQNPNPGIMRIRTKFCNKKELDVYEVTENKLDYLCKIWSAKEAVFKIFGENIPFAEGMLVRLNKELTSLSCDLDTRGLVEKIPLEMDLYRDYHLIYGRSFL